MDKTLLFEYLSIELKKNLELAMNAAQATYDIATHEDNKAENKYDTRGLEASYLAGAQAQRVAEMMDVLLCFKSTALKNFHDGSTVAITALVEVILNEKTNYLLIMPLGGGQTVKLLNQTIQVVTPISPLGKALIGQSAGEIITILAGGQKREYEIASIQ